MSSFPRRSAIALANAARLLVAQTWPRQAIPVLQALDGPDPLPSEHQLAQRCGTARTSIRRLLENFRDYGLITTHAQHWRHEPVCAAPADASSGTGIILVRAAACIATALAEALADSRLLVLWDPDRLLLSQRHPAVVATVLEQEPGHLLIHSREQTEAQIIRAAGRSAADRAVTGRLASHLIRLAAAGMSYGPPIDACPASDDPHQSLLVKSDDDAERVWRCLQPYRLLAPLPPEQQLLERSGLTRQRLRLALAWLADHGQVLHDASRRWRIWREYPLPGRPAIQIHLDTQAFGVRCAGLLEQGLSKAGEVLRLDQTDQGGEHDRTRRLCLLQQDSPSPEPETHRHIVEIRNTDPSRPSARSGIGFDFEPLRRHLLRSLRDHGCRHLMLIIPQTPPLLRDPLETLVLQAQDAGLHCLPVRIPTNLFHELRSTEDQEAVAAFVRRAARERIAIYSMSAKLVLGHVGILGRYGYHLSKNLIPCLPREEAVHLDHLALPTGQMSWIHVGQVATWMLLEQALLKHPIRRHLAIRPALPESDR